MCCTVGWGRAAGRGGPDELFLATFVRRSSANTAGRVGAGVNDGGVGFCGTATATGRIGCGGINRGGGDGGNGGVFAWGSPNRLPPSSDIDMYSTYGSLRFVRPAECFCTCFSRNRGPRRVEPR